MPLNFYELYNLLSENTVSQEIKKFKKEKNFDVEKLLPIAYKEIKSFLPNINDKSLRIIANWVLFEYFPRQPVQTVRPSFWFSDYLKKLALYVHSAYLSSQLDENGNWSAILNSKFNNTNFKLEDLVNLDQEYHDNLKKKQRNTPGAEGKTVLSFPDGYKWVNLEKKYCDIEAKSMGHCGNAGAKPGDTILSLRDSKNVPHLTFILNNGVLGERKGRANEKPKPKYHPYIIELLKLPIIKDLGKGTYLQENDFKLSDLNEDELENLIKAKPVLQDSLDLEKLYGKTATAEVLDRLANNKDWNIRELVAQDKKTNPETLEKLADDERPEVQLSVARNVNTPEEILVKLSNAEFGDLNHLGERYTAEGIKSTMKRALVNNPKTPEKVISVLIKDKKHGEEFYKILVRKYSHDANYNNLDFLKKTLYNHKEIVENYEDAIEIFKMIAHSPRITEDMAEKILEIIKIYDTDSYSYESTQHMSSAILVNNPKTPINIIVKIAEDLLKEMPSANIKKKYMRYQDLKLCEALLENKRTPENYKSRLTEWKNKFNEESAKSYSIKDKKDYDDDYDDDDDDYDNE